MEILLEWLPRIGAGLMVIIGLLGFFRPHLMLDPMNIRFDTPVAISEVRAVFGGINLGGGLAALLLQEPLVYGTLSAAWGFATLARCYSIASDGISMRDAIPGLIVDGGLAGLFLFGLL